jgi:hypothetical protein
MSELRRWMGRGLLVAAMAGLLMAPTGCVDTGSVLYVPEDTTDSTGEQGSQDVRVDLEEVLRQPVDRSAPEERAGPDDGAR